MIEKRFKRKAILDKLKAKNRLIILNDDTFEEIFSFKLNLLNVFVAATLGAIFLISITSYLIAFTPLREYIPGYASTKLKQDALNLGLKSDSLEYALKKNDEYIKSLKKVLTGDLEYANVNKDSIMASEYVDPSEYNFSVSDEEIELRKQLEEDSKKATKDLNKKK